MVKYLINNILDKKLNIDELILLLKKYRITVKEYDNILLLYRNYNSDINNEIERECRSLVICKDNYNIIAYSCPIPTIINNINYNYNYLKNGIITKCYEGTYITVFYYNNKWNISSRKCINEGPHYELFLDTIDGISFFNNLNESYIYNFILIHYNNIQVIDYTDIFGVKYKKLCLTCIRNSVMNEIDLDLDLDLFNNIIFKSEKINYKENCSDELIIKINNNLFKIENYNYKLSALNQQNIYLGMIFSYQNNKLDKNFKILNYNAIGLLSLLFKILSEKYFKMFSFYYDINTGIKNINTDNSIFPPYINLDKDYKNVLYNIRGIYLSNNKIINQSNIYNYIKYNDTILIYNLIKKEKNITNNKMINNFLNMCSKE